MSEEGSTNKNVLPSRVKRRCDSCALMRGVAAQYKSAASLAALPLRGGIAIERDYFKINNSQRATWGQPGFACALAACVNEAMPAEMPQPRRCARTQRQRARQQM